jgi:hypothetical protein
MYCGPSHSRSLKTRLVLAYTLAAGLCMGALLVGLDALLRMTVNQSAEAFVRAEADRLADLAVRRKPRILQAEMDRWAQHHGSTTVFAAIYAPDGSRAAASDLTGWSDAATSGDATSGPDQDVRRRRAATHGGRLCVARRRLPNGGYVVVGRSDAGTQAWVARVRALAIPGMAVSLLAGAFIAGRLMQRLIERMDRIRRTAEDIAAAGLDGRVPLDDAQDELRDLAEAFNRMLDRIAALVGELRSVSDHIAHELRTPLTRIRGTLEPWLTAPLADASVRSAIADAIEECDRLSEASSAMLRIARLRAAQEALPSQAVDVSDVVRRVLDGLAPLAEDKGVRTEIGADAGAPQVPGSPALLERVAANLIENAIRHTPPGGAVRVDVRPVGTDVVLSVTDTGPGIPDADLPHVFDRYHRGRGGGSAGLGLALVQAVAEAHGGRAAARNLLGGGACFEVRLPVSSPPATAGPAGR